MKIIFSILLLSSILFAQNQETFVTVYNQDLGLIKEIRTVEVDPDRPVIQFRDVAARIIPTSVHLQSAEGNTNLRVLEQNFEYDLVSAEKILEKYIDHEIQIVTESGSLITGQLLSISGGKIVIRPEEGIKIIPYSDNLQISVRDLPEGLITRPTLIWQVSGLQKTSPKLEVSYLTGGLNWQAEYVGILYENDRAMDISAWVNIENNSGATYKDARLKLVAGDIHRAPRPRQPLRRDEMVAFSAKTAEEDFEERAFFEYHLYTLQRPATLKDNQIKQISLFPATSTSVEKKFVYEARKDPTRVEVQAVFRNVKESGLGMPLPEGIFRVYKKDGESLEFIGEDRITHTPRNEEVKITVGKAFDIRAERVVKDRRQISDRARSEVVEIEIRNNKEKDDVEVLIVEYFNYPQWKLDETSHPCEKKSANKCEFRVPVKAGQKATLKYQVTYSW